jgi:hypothetical protein
VTPRRLARVSIVLAGLAFNRCGTTSTALDVRYHEQGANRALLASAAPRRVQISPVVDRRIETARVGSRPRGGGDLVTSRPVAEIVQDALSIEVSKNGHAVVSDRPDVVLTTVVEAFWLDALDGYSSLQYVGKVVIVLTVVDGRTGETLLTRQYVGIKRREVDKPDESQWREVLETALARTVHDLATDPDLVATLARVPTAARATVLPRWPSRAAT